MVPVFCGKFQRFQPFFKVKIFVDWQYLGDHRIGGGEKITRKWAKKDHGLPQTRQMLGKPIVY